MSRVRSPNYPVMSLPAAVERIRKVYGKENHLAASPDVVAKHLGYSGLNGASTKMISAMSKYGLLEEVNGNKVKVSPLALRILFPKNEEDKVNALRIAAFSPGLFAEIQTEWEGHQPSDENLRSFLVHRNFASDALDRVIHVYRETMTLVTPESEAYGQPDQEEALPEVSMLSAKETPAIPAVAPLPSVGADPFRLGFTPSGGLEGTFRLNNAKELEEMVRTLSNFKILFTRMDDIKHPANTSSDDD